MRTSAVAADVYVSFDETGAPQYASQAYDKSYTLLLREKTPRSIAKTKKISNSSSEHRSQLLPLIRQTAETHGIDPALLSALIEVESGFNPRARSPKGAMGLMQLIPETASRYGVRDSYDIRQNLDGGTRYLKDLLTQHQGNLPLALAAYNAGQTNVSRHQQRIPPFGETLLYVPMVLARMDDYQRQTQETRQ